MRRDHRPTVDRGFGVREIRRQFRYSGRVVDSEGNALAGAAVAARSHSWFDAAQLLSEPGVRTGRLGLLERLRGDSAVEDVFTTVPGIGPEPPPMAIGPHPHTGLATVTWLLGGEVLHSDYVASNADVIHTYKYLLRTTPPAQSASRKPMSARKRLTPPARPSTWW